MLLSLSLIQKIESQIVKYTSIKKDIWFFQLQILNENRN